MKKDIILVIVLFCVLCGFSPMGKIRYDDPIKSGTEFEMHVNVINDVDEDMDDMKIRMFIPELGILVNGNPFTLQDGEKMGRYLFWETGEIPPGEYLVKVTASNDKVRDVKYRHIIVI